MERHKIYFGKTGLTSTSANAIANKAKEYISSNEIALKNISFVSESASLISSNVTKELSFGMGGDKLNELEAVLKRISDMKSLQAWLREAIKARDVLKNEITNTTFDKWAKANNIDVPNYIMHQAMTEDEYLGSLSVKERNEYYSLETYCAVLGNFIHLDSPLNKARKELAEKISKPNRIAGDGINAIIYSYVPSVSEREVDNMFFKLTKLHRESQAQLNKMKHTMEVALEESKTHTDIENSKAYEKYTEEMEKLRMQYNQWKDQELKNIRDLKIQIPNSLKEIYDFVNKL